MNGQAKIDFEKWLNGRTSAKEMLKFLPKSCYNTLIIEWFDSVGIGIDAYTSLINKKLYWSADIICEFDIERESATINLNLEEKTRQEATEKAIEKAVEIYNNLK